MLQEIKNNKKQIPCFRNELTVDGRKTGSRPIQSVILWLLIDITRISSLNWTKYFLGINEENKGEVAIAC